MNDNLKILPMLDKDVAEILKIEQEQNVHILSSNVINLELKNPNSIFYIAKINDTIVGYLSATYLIDHIDIDSIVVKKDYQRQKIASILLNYIILVAKSKQVEKIFLEVRKSNIAAINLYEKFNFKNISIRKNYYSDNGEDAIIYMLEI